MSKLFIATARGNKRDEGAIISARRLGADFLLKTETVCYSIGGAAREIVREKQGKTREIDGGTPDFLHVRIFLPFVFLSQP